VTASVRTPGAAGRQYRGRHRRQHPGHQGNRIDGSIAGTVGCSIIGRVQGQQWGQHHDAFEDSVRAASGDSNGGSIGGGGQRQRGQQWGTIGETITVASGGSMGGCRGTASVAALRAPTGATEGQHPGQLWRQYQGCLRGEQREQHGGAFNVRRQRASSFWDRMRGQHGVKHLGVRLRTGEQHWGCI
jgi:hypothetical protein